MTNPTIQKSHSKIIALLLLLVGIIAAAVIYFGIIKPELQTIDAKDLKIDGVVISPAKEVANFRLTDNNGQPFTKENLQGHWTMMFFGFSNCGLVCPTTLASLNKMYQILQRELPDKNLPQIVMVSVDPERDTVAKMNTYVKTFNPNFIGTRGEMTETIALEKQFHIVAIKKQEGNDKNNYYYDHSAEILLLNPTGKLQAYLSYPHVPEEMVKDYKLILKNLSVNS